MQTEGLTERQIREIMQLAIANFNDKKKVSEARALFDKYCRDEQLAIAIRKQAQETYNFQIRALAYIPTL